MAIITKTEIITAAVIVISLVILFIIDGVTPMLYNATESYPVQLYRTIASIASAICVAICCLHLRRALTVGWKSLVLIVFFGSSGAVLSLSLLLGSARWDFAFLAIFGIDTIGTVVFLLLIFTRDKNITISLSLAASSLVLLYIHLNEYADEQFDSILLSILSILIYLILQLIYFKHLFKCRWIVALITLTSACAIVAVAILFKLTSMIPFYFVTSIDACSALFLSLWIIAQKVWHQDTLQDDPTVNFLKIAGLPARFSIKQIEAATGNFRTPVGEGGSGAVFKGTLPDGSVVAVKRIKGQPDGESEFTTEITIIASLQHFSLVRLLGYGITKGGDRYLVYPFFENGSLDAWLFRDEEKRARLTWNHRYRVATDVAKALAYFHHECHHQVLHLDIKPANILLDGNFRALVSDFGISKLIGKDESSVMTRARGTIGYLPPEMLVPNAISTKSDVYSYGMVLLELVGGRRNFETVIDIESQQQAHKISYFPKLVKEKMLENKIMEVVDPCLEHEEVRGQEVFVLVRVALWCVQENPELRPSTTEIVGMLKGWILVPVPPNSPMFVVNIFNIEEQTSSSNLTNLN